MNRVGTLAAKEIKEQLLASKGIVFLLVASVILSIFSLVLITNKELSLLGNAQAVYMMAGIIMSLIGLIAVLAGSDSIAGERDRKTLETLVITPITGHQIVAAKITASVVVFFLMYLISVPYIWAVAGTGQNLFPSLAYIFVSGFLITIVFAGFSMTSSIKIKSFKGTLFINLTILILLLTPLLLSPSLRRAPIGKVFDTINPFANVLNTLDSVIIDSQGISFQLVRMGVVLAYAIALWLILKKISRRIEL